MRIAVDARLTDYSAGGITEYIQQLTARLPQLDTLNEYLVLNAMRSSQRHDSDTHTRTVKCWTPAHHVLERYSLTLELLHRNIHLLHSPDFIPPHGGPWLSQYTICLSYCTLISLLLIVENTITIRFNMPFIVLTLY